MFDRIRTLLNRLHEAKEVNALTDRDLEDIGISRAQMLDFLRMPEDINERVIAMGAIFGVPAADLKRDYGLWLDLLTTCGHCTDRAACSRALDRGADPADCGFCGNRAAFADLSHPHAA
jgi:hypothetical protein